jgi:hypothetical protein
VEDVSRACSRHRVVALVAGLLVWIGLEDETSTTLETTPAGARVEPAAGDRPDGEALEAREREARSTVEFETPAALAHEFTTYTGRRGFTVEVVDIETGEPVAGAEVMQIANAMPRLVELYDSIDTRAELPADPLAAAA